MGIINIHNYESFYLDLLDGTISDKDKEKLLAFLYARPDLKVDLEELEFVRLDAEIRVPFDSSALLQTINRQNAEDYIINDIEKQLDADDKQELGQLIHKHDDLQDLYRRYQKTILPADDVIFPDKDSLKKGGRHRVMYYLPLMGAVAAVLLLILVYSPDRIPGGGDIASKIEPSNSINDSLRAELQTNDEEKETVPVAIQKSGLMEAITPVLKKKVFAELSALKNKPGIKKQIGNLDTLSSKQERTKLPEVVAGLAVNQQVVEVVQGVSAERINDEMNGFNADTLVHEKNQNQKLVASEALSVKEWVRSQLREKLFRGTQERTGKIQSDEVINSVASAIDRNTGDNFALDFSADGERKTYTVSFGRFSFTRIKSKK